MSQEMLPGMSSEVTLAPLTKLELGGTARYFLEIENTETAREAIRWARRHDLPLAVIAGGSNVVVADAGWPGLVLRVAMRGMALEREGDVVRVTAAAGEPWDELVTGCVGDGLAGIECLAGIPGSVGATPIQNVGAYGQEVSEVVENVQVLDLMSLEVRSFSGAECGFGYRTSSFREVPGRFLVLAVTFRLLRGGTPTVTYRELERALGARGAAPTVAEVRDTVLELRRAKSMVFDETDPNRRSVGSFFVNPVLDAPSLAALEEEARGSGALLPDESLPSFPTADGRSKVSILVSPEGCGVGRSGSQTPTPCPSCTTAAAPAPNWLPWRGIFAKACGNASASSSNRSRFFWVFRPGIRCPRVEHRSCLKP